MDCAEGQKKSGDEQEAEDCLYKCNISVVPLKAWRSVLMGWFGSVEQLIGHFSIREEFMSQLSAWPLLYHHAVGLPGSSSQLVCISKANDNTDHLQMVSVCVNACIIEDPKPH